MIGSKVIAMANGLILQGAELAQRGSVIPRGLPHPVDTTRDIKTS